LDTAKFLDYATSQKLFLCRADKFEDQFEGSFTQSIRHAIEKSYHDNQIAYTYEQFKERLRQSIYVNCWHKSPNDSMAMWKLYGASNFAVAVTTTVQQLETVVNNAGIDGYITIKKVKYVKHWKDPSLSIKPYSNVFAYKVTAYDYEKEVRVIVDRFDDKFSNNSSGIIMPAPAKDLIRSIVVSPEAPDWYKSMIEKVAQDYGITAPVRRSKLATDPI
ncbi:hypothetical protein HUW63_38115, partial [Myxococcus sp. AM001]|nr:hypothetical protein [Myxococcus sp. AM001]